MAQLLPMGYKFNPSDVDIISYLTQKHSPQPLPAAFVPDRPLYAADASWDFHADFAAYTAGRELHFFVPLHHGSSDDNRVVGNGTWIFERTSTVRHSSGVGGFKKLFTFWSNNDSQNKGLIMYEYTLADRQDWAVCRIKRVRSTDPSDTTHRSYDIPTIYIPSAATLKRQQFNR